MTKREVVMLFGVITNLYPNDKRFEEADANMRDAWHELLQDIDLRIASKAVAAHAATQNFPPTIAEIRRFCIKADAGSTAEQAWALVYAAICDSGYHAKERFEELPEICKRLVGSPNVLKEWGLSEDGVSVSVARTRFLAQYDIEKRREIERRMIPPSILQALNEAVGVNLLEGGTQV